MIISTISIFNTDTMNPLIYIIKTTWAAHDHQNFKKAVPTTQYFLDLLIGILCVHFSLFSAPFSASYTFRFIICVCSIELAPDHVYV